MDKFKNAFLKTVDALRYFFTVIINPDIRFRLGQVWRKLGYVLHFALRIAVILVLIVVLTAAIVGAFGAIYITHYLDVDTVISLEIIDMEQSSQLYAPDPDTEGEWILLETISGLENRIWVPYSDIPKDIINAVVAIEDKRFFYHDGVDWKRTVGAFVTMFLGSESDTQYGGSTITQQLIKNRTGEDDVTVARKIQEIFRALELEKRYSQETILEWYLNTIYLGRGCNGVLTAAETYYGKDLSELTLAECAALVGVTNNPSYYDPFNRPQNTKERQETILGEMVKLQMISEAEYEEAIAQPLVFKSRETEEISEESIRSWYVDQALKDLRLDLMEANGWPEVYAAQYINTAGLNVYLCIDLKIQEVLDRIWADPDCWPASPDEEPPESAMMICDPYTGNVLAMIGGREKTGNTDFNRATQAKRQPGSSIKPLTVYSQAMEMGLVNPYTPVDDIPVALVDDRGWPRNSPIGYSGHINIITGLTKSKNTISVQLLQQITPETSFYFARDKLHLSSLVEGKSTADGIRTDMDISPLALGGLTDGVTVREMTAAFGAFPNGGYYYKPRTYTHVTDQEGRMVFSNDDGREQVFSEKTSFYMTQCLLSATSSVGTGVLSRLTSSATIVAGKTGTTSANNDRWFVGFTPYYSAACWFGYDIPRPLEYGNNPAVHLWQQVMDEIHKDLPAITEFPMPGTITKVTVCRDSGLLPTDACRLDPREQIRPTIAYLDVDDVPTKFCDVHYIVGIDLASGHLATPYCPDATCSVVGLMYLPNRFVPVPMSLPDEEYTVRLWGGVSGASFAPSVPLLVMPEDFYKPYAVASKGTDPYNSWCPLHRSAADVPAPVETPTPAESPPPENQPPDGQEPEEPPDGGGQEGAAQVDAIA